MKSILRSIQPKSLAKILNGEATIIISKTAPKCDLPIDVYIYCTNDKNEYLYWDWYDPPFVTHEWFVSRNKQFFAPQFKHKKHKNGKVVAKFTLNKIENFINGMNELEREWDGKPDSEYDYFAYEKALEKACLTYEEAEKYCPDQSFYAWHISDLVIFDEPRELDDFDLKKAPQSWCYVEEKA